MVMGFSLVRSSNLDLEAALETHGPDADRIAVDEEAEQRETVERSEKFGSSAFGRMHLSRQRQHLRHADDRSKNTSANRGKLSARSKTPREKASSRKKAVKHGSTAGSLFPEDVESLAATLSQPQDDEQRERALLDEALRRDTG